MSEQFLGRNVKERKIRFILFVILDRKSKTVEKMSLVAYAASSDEDSDCESIEAESTTEAVKPAQNACVLEQKQSLPKGSKSLKLPQPKHKINDDDDETDANRAMATDDFKLNLPQPKKLQNTVEEADDEFLRKKVLPSMVEEKPSKLKPGTRQPVKITIPSLSELGPDDRATNTNGKSFSLGPTMKKPSGLLNQLPPPKFDGIFGKPKEKPDSTSSASLSTATSITKPTITKTTSLIPHSVSKKQAAAKSKPVTDKKATTLGLSYNNSDDSDNDEDASGDFFSLNTEDNLPEVSAAEIEAMVAKKANKMAEATRNLKGAEQNTPQTYEYVQPSTSRVPEQDDINIERLIGARAAKRSRKDNIQFIDISQDQVTSSHDEWKRNQLASETQFQPTGRLTAGDPGAGTKKKHQITYLAYQAKANEAELQAMWATNRQSRRQTQSKYGF